MNKPRYDYSPLARAIEDKTALTANVEGAAVNGYRVNVLGFHAFLPEWETVSGTALSISQEVQVCVKKFPPASKNVIVSMKEPERRRQLDKIQKYKRGDILTVRVLKKYKSFVAVSVEEGVAGRIYPDTRRFPVNRRKPAAAGETIEAVVLRTETGKRGTYLVLRPVQPAPQTDLKVGDLVDATVESICNYGAYVSIGPVIALIHRSELSWTNRGPDPKTILGEGDPVRVKVLNIEDNGERISVSLRQTLPDPWDAPELAPGYRFDGTVVRRKDYGVFVRTPQGPAGLLHVSNIAESWPDRGAFLKSVKVGDILPVTVLSIDRENRRIELGLQKQQ